MSIIGRVRSRFEKLRFRYTISKIIEYRNIEGWLTDNEAFGLYIVAEKVKRNGTIVEIGSWKGKSTFCLAKGLKSGKIFAIDPFNAEGEPGSKEIYENTQGEVPLFEQFIATMKRHGLLDKIEPLKGFSNQFLNHFEQIDFLFIDGDHSIEGCDYDYTHFSRFVKTGGYIAFHDYDPGRVDLGPTWVINNRLTNGEFKFYKRYDTLWIAKKRAKKEKYI